MLGEKIEKVNNGLKVFAEEAAKFANNEDRISIITFGSRAEVVHSGKELKLLNSKGFNPELKADGGATNFEEAIKVLVNEIKSNLEDSIPIFIFMTDGENTDGSYPNTLNMLR